MKKSGQVWIETVLYTLIGLALIGLALGFIMPKINEARDKAIVDQAINSLAEFDARVNEVIETGTGNIRQIDFYMKKGLLYINASGNEINMVLEDLLKPYSEPGVEINIGRIKVLSLPGQKTSIAYLRTTGYGREITYNGRKEDRQFAPASTPYKFRIWNNGSVIDITEVSTT